MKNQWLVKVHDPRLDTTDDMPLALEPETAPDVAAVKAWVEKHHTNLEVLAVALLGGPAQAAK